MQFSASTSETSRRFAEPAGNVSGRPAPASASHSLPAAASRPARVDASEPLSVPSTASTSVKVIWDAMLQKVIDWGASDLHLSAQRPQFVRMQGRLQPLLVPGLTKDRFPEVLRCVATEEQVESFRKNRSLDLAFTGPGGYRFRVNAFFESGEIAMAIRRLEERLRSVDELHLPPALLKLTDQRDGLILVTGPTGSGKSTTLATMLNHINLHRSAHIITVEDPIEYLHPCQKSLVQQRELGSDVPSFSQAVIDALREDPNVLLVGEMRDLATMRAAITAAETGHLVFSTLHTGDAVGAIDRMIGVFPAEEQPTIRAQLAATLRAVIAQKLVATRTGGGRVPVLELLTINPAVSNLIRTARPQQIYSIMEAGAGLGMITREQSLSELLQKGMIEPGVADNLVRDPALLAEMMKLKAAAAANGGGRS